VKPGLAPSGGRHAVEGERHIWRIGLPMRTFRTYALALAQQGASDYRRS
jgi:hypothetical protein